MKEIRKRKKKKNGRKLDCAYVAIPMLSMGTMAAQHMHWSISIEISSISDFVYMDIT
jgi:hypothetical protein